MFAVAAGAILVAIALALIACMATGAACGLLNGLISTRWKIPSFIVTLAFLFILRGFTIFIPQTIESKTIIGGIRDAAEGDWLAPVFGGKVGGWIFDWLAEMEMIDVFMKASSDKASSLIP